MIGFSVQPIARRVGPEFVRKFRSLPVANVSDCMSRLTGGGPRLRRLSRLSLLWRLCWG